MTIKTLPDEALLEVFEFFVHDTRREGWITLVHVCRRWRCIIFASPLRLNLKLYCDGSKPVREMLDTWPPLPIVIEDDHCSEEGADNIIAALEHNDRVHSIAVYLKGVSGSLLGRLARAMREPFPQLIYLALQSADETPLAVPRTFLGGSAVPLRLCMVDYLPFPALRNLLLSAHYLVRVHLLNIPHSEYISPKAIVSCLSAATSLKFLELRFLSPRSRPNRATRRPPPLTHTILPALTDFHFRGVSEYLEDFISRVDAPLLDVVNIRLFHQLTFDVSQLHQFISRTEILSAFNIADVVLADNYTEVELSQQTPAHSRPKISLSIWCNRSDWQLSFQAQACNSLSPILSTFETLIVHENEFRSLRPGWEDDMENSQWLELFHPFTSLKNLYLSEKLVPLVSPALQHLAEESVTDMLPMLQNLYLNGLQQPSVSIQEGIGQFVAARQLFNHPMTVIPWDGRPR